MKAMAADADPTFEVATIKPGDPDARGGGFRTSGRQFGAINFTLNVLVQYAYGVQVKQIAGEPAWFDKDKFTISAVPDAEGQPSPEQIKIMLRKLLADRFRLTLHHEMRELPVYVLSVAKGGPKLTKNESGLPGPGSLGLVMPPAGIKLMERNGTMSELASMLEQAVVDRPVLDRTGLKDRYDVAFTFAATGTEVFGRESPASDGPSAPSLFTAVQAFGLKLEPVKAAVDVLVIDRVDKPTGN